MSRSGKNARSWWTKLSLLLKRQLLPEIRAPPAGLYIPPSGEPNGYTMPVLPAVLEQGLRLYQELKVELEDVVYFCGAGAAIFVRIAL